MFVFVFTVILDRPYVLRINDNSLSEKVIKIEEWHQVTDLDVVLFIRYLCDFYQLKC